MKRSKHGIIFLLSILSAVCISSCTNSIEPGPKPPPPPPNPTVKISANKTAIKANGTDSVVFTIVADDEEVASDFFIIHQNETEAQRTDTIRGNMFLTKDKGAHTFYAVYKEAISDTISIDATAIVLLLTTDKETIKANGKEFAQFTVMADDSDVTSLAVITLVGAQDSILDESTFATKDPSTYTFYATYDGIKSDEVSVEAIAISYLLSADKQSIKADGLDKAVFSVLVDGENVTTQSTLFLKKDKTETAIDKPVFSTDEYGTCTFYAIYDGKKTNDVTLNAEYVDLQFVMQYMVMDFTSTICPNCVRMEPDIQTVQNGIPGRLHRLALHMGGKFCDSGLDGILGPIANNLSSDDYFPSVKVDLKYVEYLSQTTTPSRISRAIDNATRDRNWVSETGIAIESRVNGSNIDFTVKVKSIKTDNYRFFAFIVEDGIVYSQQIPDLTAENGFVTVKNYIHNDVATYSLTNDPLQGVDFGQVVKGKETVKNYTVSAEGNIKRIVDLTKCRIIAYTIRQNGVVDNVVNCPVNGSVKYQYIRD